MSEYKLPDNQDCFQQNYDMRQEEIAAEIAAMNRNYHGHDTDDDGSPKVHLEQEKRVRREIANSNERRRMQSINAGFASLRNLIPHHKGEKLSKAAILQQASDFLHNLVQEKACLLSQNAQLKRMIEDISNGRVSDTNAQESPPPKRKKRDTESSDEGISMSQESSDDAISTPTTTPPSATIESSVQVVQREICELRGEFEAERQIRKRLEDQTQVLEDKIYPEGIRHISQRMEIKVKDDDHIILGSTRSEITSCTDDDEEDTEKCKSSLQQCPYSYSLSRRNLNTIVAAIRHLEGDRIALTDKEELKLEENERYRIPAHSDVNERECHRVPPHSEDSERETLSSTSDQEDIKSDSSGRDSPVNLHVTRPISQTLSSAILSSPHSLPRSHHSVSPGIATLPISANTGIIPRLLEAPPITIVAAAPPQTFYSHINVPGPEQQPGGGHPPPFHTSSHPQGPVIEFRTLTEKFPMSIPYHLHHTVPTVYHHRPGVIVHNASS